MRSLFTLLFCGACCCDLNAQHLWLQPVNRGATVFRACRDSAGGYVAVVPKTGTGPVTWSVNRFDGTSWSVLSSAERSFPLPDDTQIWDVACAPDGSIIVAARTRVLRLAVNSNRWDSLATPTDGYTYRDFKSIAILLDGTLFVTSEAKVVTRRDTVSGTVVEWISTFTGELWEIGPSFRSFERRWAGADSAIAQPADPSLDPSGALWTAWRIDDGKVMILNIGGDHVAKYRTVHGSRSIVTPLTTVCAGASGIWIGTRAMVIGRELSPAQLLFVDDADSIRVVQSFSGDATMSGCGQLRNGDLAISILDPAATSFGVYLVSGESMTHLNLGDYFSEYASDWGVNYVYDLAVFGDSILLGTGDGLIVLQPAWVPSAVDSDLPHTACLVLPTPSAGHRSVTIVFDPAHLSSLTRVSFVDVRSRYYRVPWRSVSANRTVVDVAGLDAGIYFAELVFGDGRRARAKLLISD